MASLQASHKSASHMASLQASHKSARQLYKDMNCPELGWAHKDPVTLCPSVVFILLLAGSFWCCDCPCGRWSSFGVFELQSVCRWFSTTTLPHSMSAWAFWGTCFKTASLSAALAPGSTQRKVIIGLSYPPVWRQRLQLAAPFWFHKWLHDYEFRNVPYVTIHIALHWKKPPFVKHTAEWNTPIDDEEIFQMGQGRLKCFSDANHVHITHS